MRSMLRSRSIACGLMCALVLSLAPFDDSGQADRLPRRVRPAVTAFASSSLHFIANQGQVSDRVAYYLKGPEGIIYFTPDAIVYDLVSAPGPDATTPNGSDSPDLFAKSTSRALRNTYLMRPLGASDDVQLSPGRRLPATVNYLIGSSPEGWRSGIPTYGEITYEELYPGIDLVVYGTNDRMEYDFVVEPGADPGAIQMALEGVDAVRVGPAGDLVIETPLAKFRHLKPVAYQEIGAERRPVEGAFRVEGNRFGFELGNYDPAYELVIDPVTLAYATYLGGTKADSGNDIDVDDQGSVYVVGTTESLDFPTKRPYRGAFQGGDADAFLAKFDSSGQLAYATYLGGDSRDQGNAIVVRGGTAYVAGMTESEDYPTVQAYQAKHQGNYDAFITLIDASGGGPLLSTYFGGAGYDTATEIAVDSDGNAYITGRTESLDFPYKGGYQDSLRGAGDAFVAKLYRDLTSGSRLCYSTFLGGDGHEEWGQGIDVDEHGNAYVAGRTESDDFPRTLAPYQMRYGGGDTDAFVTKLWPSGRRLAYSTFLGGSDDDSAHDIAVQYHIEYSGEIGSYGVAYVVGHTKSSDYPTHAAYQDRQRDGDGFVTVLNFFENELIYSTYLGGSRNDAAGGVALADGHAYVTGSTFSSDFPTVNAFQEGRPGTWDSNGFVTRFGLDGQIAPDSPSYSTYLGGSDSELAWAIAVDAAGSAYVTGQTESNDFPVRDAYQKDWGGFTDVFVAKLAGDAPAETTEDFDDGLAQGWLDDGSGTWQVKTIGWAAYGPDSPSANGVYETAGRREDKHRFSHYQKRVCDFTYQADVRKTDGDSDESAYPVGIVFRSDAAPGQRVPGSYYEFVAVSNGYYMLGKRVDGGAFQSLVDWTRSSALGTGHGTWNTLEVTAEGERLRLYVNDELVETVHDSALQCGYVGLFAIDAASSNPADTVQFDNVSLRPPDAETLPTPTSTRRPPTATRSPTATSSPITTRRPTATRRPSATSTADPVAGISGRVTYNGSATAGIDLRLRLYDGSEWHTAATATTDGEGRYRFTGVPSLGPDEKYYVRYGPNSSNSHYVSSWWAPDIETYRAGTSVHGGDFDIANVEMVSPASGSTVRLPATFVWERRGIPGDTYGFRIWDPDSDRRWATGDMGNRNRYSLNELPEGAEYGREYRWQIHVYNGDDNYGSSFYYRRVTFSREPAPDLGSQIYLPLVSRNAVTRR